MPESFFSLKRIEKQIKCLLGSLIPKSFRDVALRNECSLCESMINKIRKKEVRGYYDYFTESCHKAPFLVVVMSV
jgi:hypothetical protein